MCSSDRCDPPEPQEALWQIPVSKHKTGQRETAALHKKIHSEKGFISGFTVNISQGISTFLVLFLLGKPLLEKLDRIKVKYGMMEDENGF